MHDLRRWRSGVSEMPVLGWECAVCGATRDIADPFPFRCPNATLHDRHHLLRLRSREQDADGGAPPVHENAGGNPFVVFDGRLAWAAFASAHGMGPDDRRRLVDEIDSAVAAVDGTGFRITPFGRSDELSDALGFAAEGGVWVKDETHGVAGSQKARHLMSILLQLRAAEVVGLMTERPRLAIASCGNAALGAATLARAAEWPIDVYVPTWMSPAVGDRLELLGATIRRCERRATDPPGDPAMHRFREAVEAGAVPFTVQGPENALCLDGGRTIGWEIAAQSEPLAGRLDRVFVQVGGGALATCLSDGLDAGRATAGRAGSSAGNVPLHAVQAAGCAPLSLAWDRSRELARPTEHWGDVMTVWPDPHSIADGILDDETYDWIGVVDAMRRNGGSPVVASEDDIERAHALARVAGYDVSPTGSAALAGVLASRGRIADGERVVVAMTGVAR